MKYAVILAFVALAYASLEEKTFRPNREYQYKYEGQILTGIPKTSHQFSGLKIKCLAKVVFTETSKTLLKLDHIEVLKLNKRVDEVNEPRYSFVPSEEFERIDSEEQQVLLPELQKPISFRYKQGEVSTLEYSTDEPEWSVDIKRAILNLLQVQLNKEGLPYESAYQHESHNSLNSMPLGKQLFKVKENSPSGRCDTLYTVNSLPVYEKYTVYEPTVPVLNVTKSKNFSRCDDYPLLLNTSINVQNCTECEYEKKQPIESFAHTRYNITGTRESFMIESCESEEQHVVTPYQEEMPSISTFVRQSLKLVYSGHVQSSVSMPSEKKQSGLRSKSMDHSNHGENSQSQDRQDKIKEKCLTIIKSIREDIREHHSIPSQTPTKVIHLLLHLRHANQQEVMEIYEQVKEDKELRRIFVDTLPILGTKSAIKVIKRVFERMASTEREEVYVPKCVQLLTQLSLSSSKQLSAVDELKTLCQSDSVKKSFQVEKTCWLAYGNMIHETCMKPYGNKYVENKCPSEKLDNYRKTLAYEMSSATSERRMLMVLGAIENAGLESSLHDLVYIARDSTKPTLLRIKAIYAMKRICKRAPTKVQQVLLPIYLDTEEHYELRIGAANLIIECTKPSAQVLEMISQKLQVEPNRQVGSYVWSLMKTLTKTRTPCYKQISENLKKALRFARPVQNGMHYSKSLRMDLLPEQMAKKLRIFPTVSINTVGSNKTMIPRVATGSMDVTIFGKILKLGELGVRLEGFENLMNIFKSGSSLSDYFKHPRNVNYIWKELKEIKEQMQYSSYKRTSPKALLWVDIFGTKVNMFELNKDIIQSIDSGKIFQKLLELETRLRDSMDMTFSKTMPLMNSERTIPTEMGIPLKVNLAGAIVMKNKGSMRATIQPTISQSLTGRRMPEQIQSEIDIFPSVSGVMFANITAKLSIIETGVSIKAKSQLNTPIKKRAQLNLKTMSVHTEFETPKHEVELFSMEVRPICFVKRTPFTKVTGPSPIISITEKHHEEKIRSHLEPYYKPTKVSYNRLPYVKLFLESTPLREPGHMVASPLTGKQCVRITYRRDQYTPESIETKLNLQVSRSGEQEYSQDQSSSDYTYNPMHEQARRQSWQFDDSKEFQHSRFYKSQEDQSSWEQWLRPEQERDEVETYYKNKKYDSEYEQWLFTPRTSRKISYEDLYYQQKDQPISDIRISPIYAREFIKVQAKYMIRAKCPSCSETKLEGKTTWSYTPCFTEHKIQSNIKVTPIPRVFTEEKEMCIKGELRYPFQSRMIRPFSEQVMHGDKENVKGQVEFAWGKDCQTDKKITIKAWSEKSNEQKEESYKKLYREKPEYEQCQQDRREGNERSMACRQMYKYLNQHRQLRAEVEYQNMPRFVKNITSKAWSKVRQMLYKHVDSNEVNVQNEEQKIEVLVKLQNDVYRKPRVLDVYVRSPRKNININKVVLPFSLEPTTEAPFHSQFHRYMQLYTNRNYRPTCSIWNKKMRTFDGARFDFPESDCEYVVARDNSEDESYTVTLSKSSQSQHKKTVRVYTENKKVEVSPQYNGQKVFINEQEVHIPVHHKITIREDESNKMSRPVLRIYRVDDDEYVVKVPSTGLKVHTDGNNVETELSPWSRGSPSGVCGNYNGETYKEMSGPRGELYRLPSHFFSSHSIKSPTCGRYSQQSQWY